MRIFAKYAKYAAIASSL